MKQRILSECVGTFILVFCCCAAGVVNDLHENMISHAGVAAVCGLVVSAMIYSLGEVSGAHLNPAVTIAFAFAGTFARKEIIPYVLAQCIGAVLASIVVYVLFPQHATLGATEPGGPASQAFILELILTFVLMLVILQVSSGSKEKGLFAGLAIGSAVLLLVMLGGPVSGASMNPARSLGPALVSGRLDSLWIYLVAPVIGALAAIPLHRVLQSRSGA